jgi:hypothetical protein
MQTQLAGKAFGAAEQSQLPRRATAAHSALNLQHQTCNTEHMQPQCISSTQQLQLHCDTAGCCLLSTVLSLLQLLLLCAPVELEWPQEVGCLLEGWAHSVDLVDEVLHAQDVFGAQHLARQQ